MELLCKKTLTPSVPRRLPKSNPKTIVPLSIKDMTILCARSLTSSLTAKKMIIGENAPRHSPIRILLFIIILSVDMSRHLVNKHRIKTRLPGQAELIQGLHKGIRIKLLDVKYSRLSP